MSRPSYYHIEKPHVRLAQLMLRELEVSINPAALKFFIKAHWSKVQALGHMIHDAPSEDPDDVTANAENEEPTEGEPNG